MHGFEERGVLVAKGRFEDTGRFGRMFPELRSLKSFKPGPEDLGKPGGPMEAAGAAPPAGPAAPDGGPALAPDDNVRIRAGYTFLGQFIDHDLTLDATSSLEKQIDLAATTNFRTPAFELDSVYGRGPDANPALYDSTPGNEGMLLVERDQVVDVTGGTDLPRNRQGTAILGDHRNDENRIIGQIHVLFLKFHNRVLADIKRNNDLGDSATPFEAAQKRVRWHYQWIVLNEFLTRIVGQQTVQKVLDATDRNHVGAGYMPVEFSGAAYRFGHSQIRPAYGISPTTPVGDIFPADPFAPLLKPTDPAPTPPARPDLRGGGPLPAFLAISWDRFFGRTAARSKLIDIKLSASLLNLPNSVVKGPPPAAGGAAATATPAPVADPASVGVPLTPPATPGSAAPPKVVRSLAARNLQRGIDLGLPAGETIADFLGIPRLKHSDVWKGITVDKNQLTPLWFYILREAELMHKGQHLGGVGAYVVAQTFINLLLADKVSYLWQNPAWTPTLGTGDKFTMVDLINYTLGNTALTNETLTLGTVGTAKLPKWNMALMREGLAV